MIPIKTTESSEMYIETILMLQKKHANIRSIDIVHQTGYSKPSVSRAMALLKKSEHIEMDGFGYITLTPKGLLVASKIVERHEILSKVLISLGVSPDIAAVDACRIEHVISDETFDCIKQHLREKGGE